MEPVRKVGFACVGRAVLFGSLAIACVMFAFSFNPVTAFRSGAIMTLLMSAILAWKAYAAAWQNPTMTEVWLYLDETQKPKQQHARVVFATIMREIYVRFAAGTLAVACGLFVISWIFMAFGFQPIHELAKVH